MGRVPGVTLELRASRLLAARRVEVARQVAVTAEAGDVVAVEGINGSGKARCSRRPGCWPAPAWSSSS